MPLYVTCPCLVAGVYCAHYPKCARKHGSIFKIFFQKTYLESWAPNDNTYRLCTACYSSLGYRGLGVSICVTNLGHHCYILWLVPCLVPIHYLNQCWLVVNCTLAIKEDHYSTSGKVCHCKYRLSSFRVMQSFLNPISRLRDFEIRR